ncbi:MAG: TonB-dependent receptor, partial [Acidobacteriota bacterium]
MKELLSQRSQALPLLLLWTTSISALPAQESGTDEEGPVTPTIRAEITVTSTLPEIAGGETLEPRELEARGVDDLAAGLRSTAGMDAVRRGAVNLDPTVRGLQDGQVGLFVNGTRTFAAGPARMDSDLSHLSLHDVQELRVIKGPYALSWGAGTLSAIDAVTYRPDFSIGELQLGASAHGGFESNRDASDLFTRLSGSSERFRFTVSGGYREGSDYEDGAGNEVPADYTSDHIGGAFGVKIGQGLLEYDAAYQGQDDLDYPGRLLDATYFKTRSHRLEYSWAGDGVVRVFLANGYSNAKDHLMNNDEKPTARDMPGRTPPFALDIDLPTESNTVGGAVRAELDLGSGESSFAFGADVYHVDQVADRFLRRRSNGFLIVQDAAWPETDLDNVGVWAQWNRNFDRGAFGAALRFDSNRSEATEASDFFLQNAGRDLDRSADAFSAAISGSLELSPRWTLQGGLGRAVRNPTTLELYSDRFPATKFQIPAEFLGDPNLEEEISHEVNAGVIGSWG